MNYNTARLTLLMWLLAFLVLIASVALSQTQAPAASITSVDSRTGVVTAKVNATGQTFQFTLTNRAQLAQIRIGQGVYANLKTNQVSRNGKTVSGVIVKVNSSVGSQTTRISPSSGVNVANTQAGQNLVTTPDFSIAFAPNSLTSAPQGTNVTYTLNISRIGNFTGPVQLSFKVNGYANPSVASLSPASVFLGCSASPSGTLPGTKLSCRDSATGNLTVPAAIPMPGTAGSAPANGVQIIQVSGTYTDSVHPNVPPVTHSAQITLTSTGTASTQASSGSGTQTGSTSTTTYPISSIMINEFGHYIESQESFRFLELFNASNQPYELKGDSITLRVMDQTSNTVIATFSKSTPVAGHSYYVLTGAYASSMIGGVFALRNSSGTVLDAVAFGTSNPFFSGSGTANPFGAGAVGVVARHPNGMNTNNNHADFVWTQQPTPGGVNP